MRKESSPWRRKTIRVGASEELPATLIELHRAIGGKHKERRVADPHPRAGRDGAPRHMRACDSLAPGRGHRAGIESDRLDRETDLIAFEHADESIRMIGMSVRERDDVDPTSPWGQAGAELGQESRWVRSPVDEQRSSAH